MNSLERLKEEMKSLAEKQESTNFRLDVFSKTGVFVIRNAIEKARVNQWRDEYYRQMDRLKTGRDNGYHPVEFLDLKEGLDGIWRDPAILKVVTQIFGPNVGLFKRRFVIKDKSYRGGVFLHQDTSYQLGTVEKASVFVAISESGPKNGGMILYPGTFRFGYLGDAGEIKRTLLPSDWPTVHPSLEVGDMVLMHSMTWHESSSFESGPDRILSDFIYQAANDPSTLEVVAGSGGWGPNFLNGSRGENFQLPLFQRCRTSTILDLRRKIEST